MSLDGLRGRVVVVTGASSGLGEQLARSLVAAGALPVLAARRGERLAALAAELGGGVHAVTCDVTSESDRRRLVESVLEQHGRIDGLVNNAGMGAAGPALRTPVETFSRVLELNLVAPYSLSCLAAARMREAGGGAIVNVASVMGLRSIAEIADASYVASKAGLIGLTRELGSQWGRYGIRVNAVAPGFFASEMTSELGADADSFPEWLTAQIPLGRAGRAGELDEAILYLLGPASSFVTGQVLTVDGGLATR
ncbi:MAG TPA: SDR family oxidoreductase [Solirubrobacteraceae bacterium]|nr:SDR family oxidoreductase [Solirubrobacteraceae bacterium]